MAHSLQIEYYYIILKMYNIQLSVVCYMRALGCTCIFQIKPYNKKYITRSELALLAYSFYTYIKHQLNVLYY